MYAAPLVQIGCMLQLIYSPASSKITFTLT